MPIPTLPLFLLIHTHTTTISSFLYSLLIRRRRSFCLSLSNGPLTKPTILRSAVVSARLLYSMCHNHQRNAFQLSSTTVLGVRKTDCCCSGPQLFQVVKLYTTQKKSSSAKAQTSYNIYIKESLAEYGKLGFFFGLNLIFSIR